MGMGLIANQKEAWQVVSSKDNEPVDNTPYTMFPVAITVMTKLLNAHRATVSHAM